MVVRRPRFSVSETPEVQLEELLFTQSWEDPRLDRQAFALAPGAKIATVASGGCNTLTFLLDDPAWILAFDYNATQVHTVQLKKIAIAELDYGELLELLGVRTSDRRADLLARLSPQLSDEGRSWWQTQDWLVERGLLNGGRYERFVGLFRKLLNVVQGRRKIEALFEERDPDGRREFYEQRWNTFAWRLLFKLFFNKTVLSRRGLSKEYFTFDDGSRSFAESFSRRAALALSELSVRDNPFLAQYTMGHYLSEDHLPLYLREDNVAVIRERLNRLEICVGDIRTVLDGHPEGFDAICLSNVFELMSEAETAEIMPGVAAALKPGGCMTLRNLMIPRSANVAGLELDEALSSRLLAEDRSFVYRSFQAYRRVHA